MVVALSHRRRRPVDQLTQAQVNRARSGEGDRAGGVCLQGSRHRVHPVVRIEPIIDFRRFKVCLSSLYVKFDFRKAQEMLEKCTTVLENDFFLRNYTEQFIENARQIIFETFCRIHQCIR